MTREEAITLIKPLMLMLMLMMKNPQGEVISDAYYAFDMAIKALEQEPKWIPVSERLPEEQGIYLAYIINEYDNRFQYPMTACFSPNKVGCLPQWFPDDETASNNVVAWMPLPKRYEPQEGANE